MTASDTAQALSAVHTYFNGERRELLALLVGTLLLVSAAAQAVIHHSSEARASACLQRLVALQPR